MRKFLQIYMLASFALGALLGWSQGDGDIFSNGWRGVVVGFVWPGGVADVLMHGSLKHAESHGGMILAVSLPFWMLFFMIFRRPRRKGPSIVVEQPVWARKTQQSRKTSYYLSED